MAVLLLLHCRSDHEKKHNISCRCNVNPCVLAVAVVLLLSVDLSAYYEVYVRQLL